MDQKDMLPVLANWRDTIRKADADIERFIDPLKCSPDSKLYDIPWTLMNAYTKAVSRAVGDRHDWLSWYESDNQMGAGNREVMVNSKPRKIKTLRDLARVIEETKGC